LFLAVDRSVTRSNHPLMHRALLLLALLGCQGQSIKSTRSFGLAPQPTPPISWSVTDWYLDPKNLSGVASDSNSCTSVSAPCLHWSQIITRWTTPSPSLSVGVAVHLLSEQSAGGDFVQVLPYLVGASGKFSFVGTPSLVGSSFSAGTTTPKTQGNPGTDLTIASMPAGAIAGVVVHNITRDSYAIIHSMSGTTATMEQPFSSATLTTVVPITCPTSEDDSWTTNDTLQLLSLPNLNLSAVNVSGGGFNSSLTSGSVWFQMVHVTNPNPDPTTFSSIQIANNGSALTFSLCTFDVQVDAISNNTSASTTLLACRMPQGAVVGNSVQVLGGGSPGILEQASGTGFYGNDVILDSQPNVLSGSMRFYGTHLTTLLDVDGPSSSVDLMQANALWGAGSLNLDPATTCRLDNGTWVNSLKLSALTMATAGGSTTTGTAYSAGVWTGGISLTSANLDSHAGGLQNPATGARFTN